MADHFLIRCSCGVIIIQCRCPGPKREEIRQHGCDECAKVVRGVASVFDMTEEEAARGITWLRPSEGKAWLEESMGADV